MIHHGYLCSGRAAVNWFFIVIARGWTFEANLQLYFIALGHIKVSAHLNLSTRSGSCKVQCVDQVAEYGK
ncbi:hypothetical protein D3C76_1738940 [compost metagenome]